MPDDEPYQQLETNIVDELMEVDDGGLVLRRDDIPVIEVSATNVKPRKVVHGGNMTLLMMLAREMIF